MCVCAYVCAYVGAWVRMWVRSHLANISKIVQDATRATPTGATTTTGTQAPGRPPNTGTQATTTRVPEPGTNQNKIYKRRAI